MRQQSLNSNPVRRGMTPELPSSRPYGRRGGMCRFARSARTSYVGASAPTREKRCRNAGPGETGQDRASRSPRETYPVRRGITPELRSSRYCERGATVRRPEKVGAETVGLRSSAPILRNDRKIEGTRGRRGVACEGVVAHDARSRAAASVRELDTRPSGSLRECAGAESLDPDHSRGHPFGTPGGLCEGRRMAS